MKLKQVRHVSAIPANQSIQHDFIAPANRIISIEKITCAGRAGSTNFRIIFDPQGLNRNLFATDTPGTYSISEQYIGNGVTPIRILIQNNAATPTIGGIWVLYK
jgi:hypothetical protein